MTKRKVRLDDERYLIYYTFSEEENVDTECCNKEKSEEECAQCQN